MIVLSQPVHFSWEEREAMTGEDILWKGRWERGDRLAEKWVTCGEDSKIIQGNKPRMAEEKGSGLLNLGGGASMEGE